jgi:hypothetical protein
MGVRDTSIYTPDENCRCASVSCLCFLCILWIVESDMSVLRCMKDGVVAELGTHDELIERGGEYSKLYDIQAHAFRVDAASDVRPFQS